MSLLRSFQRFDPAPCGYPRARVPALPRLSWRALHYQASAVCPQWTSHFTNGRKTSCRRGRYALRQAYQHLGVGPEGALLAPSYHCRTMLDPALRLGAPVLLYPLRADLSPDLQALEALLAEAGQPVRAMLLTHYFGFVQDAPAIKVFCQTHGIALVEDCSHAFFGATTHRLPGSVGECAVASPYKFFPCPDGGLLAINQPAGDTLQIATQKTEITRKIDWPGELRGWLRMLRELAGRKVNVGAWQSAELATLAAGQPGLEVLETAQPPGPSPQYQAVDEGYEALQASHWIVRHTPIAPLAEQRRAHYRRWLEALRDVAHGRPLYPDLPDDCVPYMFPLILEQPLQHFPLLKRLGLPIGRWDDMALSDCATASAYRLSLIHLPCHQDLRPVEMDWMIAALRAVLQHSWSDKT